MGRGAFLNSIPTIKTSFGSSSTNKNVVIPATTVVHAYKRFFAMGHIHTCERIGIEISASLTARSTYRRLLSSFDQHTGHFTPYRMPQEL